VTGLQNSSLPFRIIKKSKTKGEVLMNIKLDERLKEYMEEKGYKNILITPMICHT
jgi:hypothetical protein